MRDSSRGESKRVTVNLAESCLRALDLLGFFDKPSTPKRQLFLGIAGGLSHVQWAIGRELRAEYDVAAPMPAPLVELLRRAEQITSGMMCCYYYRVRRKSRLEEEPEVRF